MREFLHGIGLSWAALATLLAGGGIVWGAITADALMTMCGVAAGVATGIVYLWRAPRDADIRSQFRAFSDQLKLHEDMLNDETIAHDATREKLRIAKDALVELGARIKQLEGDDHGSPRQSA